jgi:hypothetical protein
MLKAIEASELQQDVQASDKGPRGGRFGINCFHFCRRPE